MASLRPRFALIGSIAEGTKLRPANELDVTCYLMPDVDDKYKFDIENAFTLKKTNSSKYHPMEQFITCGKLNYEEFFISFLNAVHGSLDVLKESAIFKETNFELGWANKFCKNCKEIAKEAPTHCKDCLFPVTHTKMGACLILKKKNGQVLTIDLIPTLPIASGTTANPLELHSMVTSDLFQFKPPSWKAYLKDHLVKDRILPDTFEEQIEGSGVNMIAMKRVHYGKTNNFVVRPAQRMKVFFKVHPEKKQVYCYLKYLKQAFCVNISSYFIKKVLVSHKTEKKSAKDILHEVVQNSILKYYFDGFILQQSMYKSGYTIPIREEIYDSLSTKV